jgi:hypothetical protein
MMTGMTEEAAAELVRERQKSCATTGGEASVHPDEMIPTQSRLTKHKN